MIPPRVNKETHAVCRCISEAAALRRIEKSRSEGSLCIAWISKHVHARVLRPFRQPPSLSAQSARSLRVGSEAESFHRAPWIGSRRAGSFDFPLCWASPFFNSGLAAGAGSHRWKARPLPSLSSTCCCRVAIAKPRTSTRVYSWVFALLEVFFPHFPAQSHSDRGQLNKKADHGK